MNHRKGMTVAVAVGAAFTVGVYAHGPFDHQASHPHSGTNGYRTPAAANAADPRTAQYRQCVRDTTKIGSGGDLCEYFWHNGEGLTDQKTWDAAHYGAGYQPLDNDESPFDRPLCTDTWALVGDTTYYVCWDGRVTTS
jgi:hypothetical protein